MSHRWYCQENTLPSGNNAYLENVVDRIQSSGYNYLIWYIFHIHFRHLSSGWYSWCLVSGTSSLFHLMCSFSNLLVTRHSYDPYHEASFSYVIDVHCPGWPTARFDLGHPPFYNRKCCWYDWHRNFGPFCQSFWLRYPPWTSIIRPRCLFRFPRLQRRLE